jgi:signal transduction histidine kinase
LNNLLHWALHQMKGIHLKKENISIQQLTDHVAEHYKDIMQFKNIQFHNTLEQSDTLFADEEATNIILRNLISNATKFTENGSITISGLATNNTYKLIIADTGAGMSQEVLDNLFTHASAKMQAGTKGERGSGLGILVIKKLLDLHNAEIQVESLVDKGTTITVTYPTNNAEA